MSKRAIILAGGKGTRLKPYTVSLPKPLVPVYEYPILEIILRQLATYGFNHVTIAVNHLSELIKAFCGDGSKWGLRIDYSMEDEPLSTMGPLTLIDDLPDNFLIMNGDILTDLNYGAFMDQHAGDGNIFSISSFQREEVSEYGVLEVNDQRQLTGFYEKPKQTIQVSMGIYAANRKVLEYIPERTFFGFDHLMHRLIEEKDYPGVYPFDGYWKDIGRPDDYQEVVDEFDERRKDLLNE